MPLHLRYHFSRLLAISLFSLFRYVSHANVNMGFREFRGGAEGEGVGVDNVFAS